MDLRKTSILLIIVLISVVILSTTHAGVEATRVLTQDFARANHLETPSSASVSVYQKARYTMSCWLQRLPSGPSPRGRGH
ncbi:Transmembrane protein [Quillaja saponaria]|uniref:Transmembrane protein n=1 Tax=Quillaja saponaria TaxID=32244 RepID=A0AAD7QFU0_QUISA|nr:Transmembrane protein [Quillaja saponaria]